MIGRRVGLCSRALPALSALVLGLACSAPTAPAPSHGIATPLGVTSSGRLPAPAPVPDKLGLQQFTPLLAEPALKKAREALEKDQVALAAREVESVLAKNPPLESDVPRWQFLLARFREQAGDSAGAAASYELAARERWPLAPYAELGAARMLVRLGRHADAVARLARVPAELPVSGEARLLAAEVAQDRGDLPAAIDGLRDHLASGAEAATRATVRLRLAEALLGVAAAPLAPALGSPRVAAAPVDQAKTLPSAGLEPTPPGSPPQAAATSGPSDPLVLAREALGIARRVRLESGADKRIAERAQRLETRALALLPRAERERLTKLTLEDELVRVQALLDARSFEEAAEAAEAVRSQLPKATRWSKLGCELAILQGKGLSGKRRYERAAGELADVVERCRGPEHAELRARALYLAGSTHGSSGRWMQAVRYYERLEREAPGDRLADDARLKAALAYFEQGVEARFTELLQRMPEDYPDGDMVLDGVFRLALRRMEKDDWSGASSVLERGLALVGERDSARGTEFSGRERYWRARAWMMTGEKERGLAELEAIIRELPLSYYMLHAYARLLEADPFRAKRARDAGVAETEKEPFSIAHRPEFDTPGFVRARELLRLGATELGRREIDALSIARAGTAPEILWGVALFYAKAGAAKLSHDIARGLLTDWLKHWPAGDWEEAWQLAFPRPYLDIVQREAKKNAIPEYLAYAIMREESSFDPQAVSPADAHGLMQLIPSTAKLYGQPAGIPWTVSALHVPRFNVALGCRALGDLTTTFKSNPLLAIPGYNAGPGKPRRWLNARPSVDFDLWVELIPYRETLRYTKRVLAARAAYAFLYAREEADPVLALPIAARSGDG